jgi:hypothetical protein
MFLGKGQYLEVSDEIAEPDRFAVEQQLLFLGLGNCDSQILCARIVLNPRLHPALRLPVLNALPRAGGAETPPVAEEKDRFQQIGFALSVTPEKKVCAGAKPDFLVLEVAEAKEAEFVYLHIRPVFFSRIEFRIPNVTVLGKLGVQLAVTSRPFCGLPCEVHDQRLMRRGAHTEHPRTSNGAFPIACIPGFFLELAI